MRLWSVGEPVREASVERTMTRVFKPSPILQPHSDGVDARFDSCANIFGNELASIIVSRLRVYAVLFSARSRGRYPMISRAISFSVFQSVIFADRSFIYPGYKKYNDSNTERELCSTFVREPVCIKACAMNGRRSLFFVPIQVQHASVA